MRRIFIILLFLLAACTAPGTRSGVREQAAKPDIRFTVIYHPDGPLYVGDRVSIEVLSPSDFKSNNKTIRVSFDGPSTSSGWQLRAGSFDTPYGRTYTCGTGAGRASVGRSQFRPLWDRRTPTGHVLLGVGYEGTGQRRPHPDVFGAPGGFHLDGKRLAAPRRRRARPRAGRSLGIR